MNSYAIVIKQSRIIIIVFAKIQLNQEGRMVFSYNEKQCVGVKSSQFVKVFLLSVTMA